MNEPIEVEWRETEDGIRPWLETHDVTWAPQPGSQQAFLNCPIFEVLYEGNRGGGKDLRLDTPVLCDEGWIPAGDIQLSHRLVAMDGSYCQLLGIFPKNDREMWRLTFRDGASVVADAEHNWRVRSHTNGWRDGWVKRTTRQLVVSPDKWSVPFMQGSAPGRPWAGPDPHMVGLMLGDGTMRSTRLCLYGSDEENIACAVRLGWKRHHYEGQVPRAICPEGRAGPWRELLGQEKGPDKRVPPVLMKADGKARLAVLQGLMDTDGSITDGKSSFTSVSKGLARNVHDLAWSLGGSAAVHFVNKESPKGGCGYYWRVNISGNNQFNPFRLIRKAKQVREKKTFTARSIRSIEREGRADAVCFAVNHPSHCFVIKDYIVTHNTDALLMDFAQHVGKGYGIEWCGILFRKTYKDLEEVVKKSKKWFPRIWPAATYNESKMFWGWPHGEKLIFSYLERPSDYEHYHGHEYPWIAFEELTKWSDDKGYKALLSCCRSPHRGMPRKFRATTNPYGAGHNWVKARFQLPVTRGRTVGPIVLGDADPKTGRRLERCVVHSDLAENRIFTSSQPDYLAQVVGSARNEAEKKAWLYGSWDIVAGGMFDDIWDPAVHVVPNFPFSTIPHTWRLNRSYDHGQSHPFSVGWWAESNGEPLVWEGIPYGVVPKDLFRIAEWYGWNGTPNEGLRMDAGQIARGILDRENDWGLTGRVKKGPADSSIFDDYTPGKSVAGDMKRKGVRWAAADKGPGSRKQGWEQLRKLLRGAIPSGRGNREAQGMFVCDRCTQFLRTFPVLPRDEKKDLDDVDTESEDHIGDECRYRLREKRTGLKVQRW